MLLAALAIETSLGLSLTIAMLETSIPDSLAGAAAVAGVGLLTVACGLLTIHGVKEGV